jgi:hypothetical protein
METVNEPCCTASKQIAAIAFTSGKTGAIEAVRD